MKRERALRVLRPSSQATVVDRVSHRGVGFWKPGAATNMRTICVLAVGLALAGCINNELSPEAMANMAQAREACKLEKPAVAKANCLNAVDDEYIRPRLRTTDLLDLYRAERVALAEKVDAGAMTPAEADLKLAQMKTEIVSEDQRRSNNAAMAAAATMATMPSSTTCSSYGNGAGLTTTCY